MANKKTYKNRNNLTCKKGSYYYRIIWGTGKYQKEKTIPLKTKIKKVANKHGKIIEGFADDVRNGIYNDKQIKELCNWLNDKGTSKIVDVTLQDTLIEYLEYRKCMVKPKTYKRDKSALNQLMNFVGYTKAVEELSYKDIEGKNGLIKHLRSKKCSDIGINTTLRHIRPYLNWLYKEMIIPKPIKFKLLPEGMRLYHYFNEPETNQVYDYIEENIDSSFLRYYHFYNQTGMRPTEPFLGELVGDWYIIPPELRKNGIPMQMQLDDELKAILLEMQSFRDTKLHCKDANVRVVDILERTIMKTVRALGFTGKKLTLYSFRHSYAIRRVTMTDIFTVQRELGHKSTDMTQRYLRFPEQRRLDDFPSLREYIEERQKMPKSSIKGTNFKGTQYPNVVKLHGSSSV